MPMVGLVCRYFEAIQSNSLVDLDYILARFVLLQKPEIGRWQVMNDTGLHDT
jgi:hypothetical protein